MKKQKIKMKFECDQSWSDMQLVSGGRFCGDCKKVVHDLTGKSVDEVLEMRKTHTELCGMFTAEQLGAGKAIEFPKVRYAAAVLAFFGLGISQADAQQKQNVKTVQLATDSLGNTVDSRNAPVCPVGTAEESSYEAAATEPAHHYKRKKYYVNGRFPFVHRKRFRTLGVMSF
jgi:hypothetical protein